MLVNNWTPLEYAVMTWLLAGDDPVLALLRAQFRQATLKSRELTGVGCYTSVVVPSGIPCLPGTPSFCFGDVEAIIPTARHGIGFLLWITDGALNFLEGYTYDEPWPARTATFTLGYIEGKRNLENLRKLWQKE